MSRTRDRNVAIALISAVALGIAVMIAVSVLGDDPEPSTGPDEPALDVPAAVVHENFNDACDAFDESGLQGKRAKAPAEADKDELAGDYLTGDSGPAVGIGLTVCGRGWIIVIGVRTPSSVVPSVGPRGTPVIAYVQPPVVAE